MTGDRSLKNNYGHDLINERKDRISDSVHPKTQHQSSPKTQTPSTSTNKDKKDTNVTEQSQSPRNECKDSISDESDSDVLVIDMGKINDNTFLDGTLRV